MSIAYKVYVDIVAQKFWFWEKFILALSKYEHSLWNDWGFVEINGVFFLE